MHPHKELLEKLQRQRHRMGESSSPLKEIGNELPRQSIDLEFKVRVKQRALRFEGTENRLPRSPLIPGRLNFEYLSGSKGIFNKTVDSEAGLLFRTPSTAMSAAVNSVESATPSVSRSASMRLSSANVIKGAAAMEAALEEAAEVLEMTASAGDVLGTRASRQASALAEEVAALAEDAALFFEGAFQNQVLASNVPGTCALHAYDKRAQLHAADGANKQDLIAPPTPSATPACGFNQHRRHFETQIVIPLRNLSPRGSPDPVQTSPVRYSMVNGDMEDSERSMTASHDELANAVPTNPSGVCDASLADCEGYEPMEYMVLDYLSCLPKEFINKLKYNMEVHDKLVQQLRKRNGKLQARVREKEARTGSKPILVDHQEENPPDSAQVASDMELPCTSLAGLSCDEEGDHMSGHGGLGATAASVLLVAAPTEIPAARQKADATPSVDAIRTDATMEKAPELIGHHPESDSWHTELRIQMASKVAAAQAARLRLGAEAHEAAMRVRLEHTCKAARERIAATTRRTQREEEECRVRAYAAKLERERVQRDLDAAMREQAVIKAQMAELEEAIRVADVRGRESEKVRKVRAREVEALRSELKVHRSRASRTQNAQHRIRDMQRELEATYAALGESCAQIEAEA